MTEGPKLFRLNHALVIANAHPPSFVTPLGRLVFELEVGGVTIPPTHLYSDSDRSVTVWSAPVWVEVLLAPASVSLPPGMAVAGVFATVWRVCVTKKTKAVILKCHWTSGAIWSDGGSESGENLDAQTWTDGKTKVTVGLPDYGAATTCRCEGFEIAVTSLRVNQGHFICAWGPDLAEDVSTWFAVDWPTARLIPADAEPISMPDCLNTQPR